MQHPGSAAPAKPASPRSPPDPEAEVIAENARQPQPCIAAQNCLQPLPDDAASDTLQQQQPHWKSDMPIQNRDLDVAAMLNLIAGIGPAAGNTEQEQPDDMLKGAPPGQLLFGPDTEMAVASSFALVQPKISFKRPVLHGKALPDLEAGSRAGASSIVHSCAECDWPARGVCEQALSASEAWSDCADGTSAGRQALSFKGMHEGKFMDP